MSEKAILFDSSKCTACKGCQIACKCWNLLPSPTGLNENTFSGTLQNPPDVNGDTRLIITFNESESAEGMSNKSIAWAFGRRSCQHCTDAPCAQVCPGGALVKDEETGFVTVDDSKCIGCQYCSSACPFDVPRYHGAQSKVNKCTGCIDRVQNGMDPACVTTCQPGALQFGDRDEMIALAHKRVEFLKSKGYEKAVVYGEQEMGGLHVIQVLKYGIEAHGQVEDPKASPMVALQQVMKPITAVGTGATVLGLGAMFALAAGYRHKTLAYNEKTKDTLDVNSGEVVKHGDAQSELSVMEHLTENLPGKKGGSHE
ncbi:4Fe-4S dicluster domain-containing protein [Slackia piriformis]|uniref:4Fe-4S dicluster domain-containing protein n=1 Tax=Slackia piriformis TaxID=626934 RepID=UPI0026DBD9A7|nr:4Fe-4S dicluster domain-containing protein [Slackia piriformis]MDO5023241.1 4Fe-4S binding protein [Slackia piriformis]